MNQAHLIGRLVKTPELRHTAKGTAVTNLRVARNEKHGETERTLFVDVTAWGRLAECCAQYVSQGDQIAVSGRLHYEEYVDSDGAKHQRLSITADSIEFLAKKRNGNGHDTDTLHDKQNVAPAHPTADEEEVLPF